jgi:hypothetical protein
MRGLAICSALVVLACGPGARDDLGNGNGDGGAPDAAPGGPGPDAEDENPIGGEPVVYAHTSSTLYSVNPDTLDVTAIGPFQWSSGGDSMTDIAVDKSGVMIGISFTAVYRVDTTTAHATMLSSGLEGLFNGLSFVPAAQLGLNPEADDVLVAIRNQDGVVFRVDPSTGQTTPIGDMGGGFASSGDLVSVLGFGTVATTDGGFGPDGLVRLAPGTFAASPVGSHTGFADIWGVAFWKDRIYGFTEGGEFVLIDPNTGAATLVQSGSEAWWGAAVTTRAPVIE